MKIQMNFFDKAKWHCYYYNNAYILWLKRNHRRFSDIVLAITAPYIILRWLTIAVLEQLYGFRKITRQMDDEKKQKFKYEIAICTTSKNEGRYIIEWVEYHRMVGIDKIYFYDNESDDNTKQMLKPYVKSGYVDYEYIAGKGQQLMGYNDALTKHKHECRWMAFIDMDEFIQPMNSEKEISNIISTIVYRAGKGACGVGINWCNYGSSGHEKAPEGLTIENYTQRGTEKRWQNRLVKTICNPRLVKHYISPHYPIYCLGGYNVNAFDGKRQWLWFNKVVSWKYIRISHFKNRSKEEFLRKRARGLGDRIGMYDMEKFDQYDLNEVDDFSLVAYAGQIKQSLETRNESIFV